MSKTDKTNPFYVKIARREGAVKPWRIYHYTADPHDCHPVAPLPIRAERYRRQDQCEIWNRYSENDVIYGRHPSREVRRTLGFENSIRTELRKLRRQWASESDRESIDSNWGAPRRKRQVRDPWHWD